MLLSPISSRACYEITCGRRNPPREEEIHHGRKEGKKSLILATLMLGSIATDISNVTTAYENPSYICYRTKIPF